MPARAALAVQQFVASDMARHDVVDQGVEMGRPSRLAIAAQRSGGTLAAVEVGGGAVFVGEGRLEIPAA